MSYRVPGAYARFVHKASAVNNVGITRCLGIVGTGATYFEVYNETIVKDNAASYDKLAYNNVFEIISVTDKALVNGNVVEGSRQFVEGTDFYLRDGNKISWQTIEDGSFAITANNAAGVRFKNNIDAVVDDKGDYLLVDGSYTLEISYIEDAWDHADTAHVNCGCYRVIDNSSKKIVGEWGVSSEWNYDAIPGLKLRIEDVFVPNEEGESITKVGDYVTITTKAPKTEIEPAVAFDETVPNYSIELRNSFSQIQDNDTDVRTDMEHFMVVDSSKVVDDDWDLEVVDSATQEIQIIQVSTGETIYGPINVNAVAEYLNIIPGITFMIEELSPDVNTGDVVRIHTQAATFGNAISENNTYYVSYKYKKADEDYEPKLFYDYYDVINEYGDYDVTASSIVINSLTLGAELAFKSGLTQIVCVQARNDSDLEIMNAIDKLKKDVAGTENVNTVVALTTSPTVGAYLKSHVNLMSAETGKHERMAYLSAKPKQVINKNPTAADKTVGMKQQAEAYSDERIVYVVPGRVGYNVKNLQTGRINERVLPGCYLALSLACIGLFNDPAEPLTRKYTKCGFTQLFDNYSETEKNALAESGCCVMEELIAGIRCRHGITTKDDEINTTEITLIQIKDYVIAQCRKTCDDLYIGIKNLPGARADIKFSIESILSQFINQEIIIGYSGLSVKQSSLDPREVLVNFEIEAVYPLNYITISFGFSSTGGQ